MPDHPISLSSLDVKVPGVEDAAQIESISVLQDYDVEEEINVRKKTDYVLLPVLCLMLNVAYLDRTNIGNARIQGMEKDLNMKGTDYNIALFMFFIPYLLLDVPANILMRRFRPSRYLGTLMFFWGIVTIGEGVTQSYAGLVVCRVILGALEAGYFPGAIYLLAMYYTRYELHARMNIYYSAALLSTAFGGLLAYAIGHMENVGGYGAWRWIFILEGLLTVIVAIFSFFALPDWPEQAKHLNEKEKAVLLAKLARDTKDYVENKSTMQVLKECLLDPKVYFSAFMYFGTAVTGSSSSYFLPTILKELGWTSLKAQYMSIPVWMTAWVASVIVGFGSDWMNHRWAFSVGPLTVAVIGYILLLCQDHISVGVKYFALFLIITGVWSAITLSLTWLNNNIMGKRRRGVATAILLAVGNCGSILGSNVYLSSEAPKYPTGYAVSLSSTILCQLAATGFLIYAWYENKQKASGARDHLLALPMEEQAALGDKHPEYRYTY
ncbi:hypothetical protein AYL99_05195 [Fonsecaea erecta]|uniref:Major facilitator superfamily (MFS) profile domain-containing protein n=1 Tax=Fonsecaea erecta TaxID=1367422 RepID=A0A178ZLV2_9EURO|nr:hypothetical protein AYL99_05195 [Fonsecaea erecta]OAP60193.1 hypothetical protein AYL99_05195 [Fonsecaea erecta]